MMDDGRCLCCRTGKFTLSGLRMEVSKGQTMSLNIIPLPTEDVCMSACLEEKERKSEVFLESNGDSYRVCHIRVPFPCRNPSKMHILSLGHA